MKELNTTKSTRDIWIEALDEVFMKHGSPLEWDNKTGHCVTIVCKPSRQSTETSQTTKDKK